MTSLPQNKTHSSCILPQSKKIAKLPKNTSRKPTKAIDDEERTERLLRSGYETFEKGEKEGILKSLKQQTAQFLGLNISKNSKSAHIDWVAQVEELDLDVYNEFLINAIPIYRPDMDLTQQRLTQLRKKIKGWFKSEGKAEKRGGAVVPEEELPQFLENIEELLNSMKVRNFNEFQEKIRTMLRELYKRLGREFKGSECSKHWWFEFQEKHEHIKALWKRLPVKRGGRVSSPVSHYSGQSTCYSPNSPLGKSRQIGMETEEQDNELGTHNNKDFYENLLLFDMNQAEPTFIYNSQETHRFYQKIQESFQTEEQDSERWLDQWRSQWKDRNEDSFYS
jgi:hypothetical protein